MSDFCRSLPEAHRSHNGLFLVLIINIGGEKEEDENEAPAKKQLPPIAYILTYKICYFQRNKKRNLPQIYRFLYYTLHEADIQFFPFKILEIAWLHRLIYTASVIPTWVLILQKTKCLFYVPESKSLLPSQ